MERIIISILLCFVGFQSHSQIAMFHAHNQMPLVANDTLFLDSFPSNIAQAYSFQKLKSSYTGYCVKVRRSSDDALQDIGFVNNYLDTASLNSFVGSNSAFVHTQYDVSGNGHNAVQTTNANQPRIKNAGAYVYQNGLPVIEYISANSHYLTLSSSGLNGSTQNTLIAIANFQTADFYEMFFTQTNASGASGNIEMRRFATNNIMNYVRDADITGAPTNNVNNQENIYNAYFTATNSEAYVGVVSDAATARTPSAIGSHTAYIGRRQDCCYYNGYFKELILFNTNLLSNRIQIYNNRNRFYHIY